MYWYGFDQNSHFFFFLLYKFYFIIALNFNSNFGLLTVWKLGKIALFIVKTEKALTVKRKKVYHVVVVIIFNIYYVNIIT